jgi:hypothetical protein
LLGSDRAVGHALAVTSSPGMGENVGQRYGDLAA